MIWWLCLWTVGLVVYGVGHCFCQNRKPGASSGGSTGSAEKLFIKIKNRASMWMPVASIAP